MFAVVQVGSSQYKVAEGDVIKTARVEGDAGKSVTLDQVLIYVHDKDIRIGKPFLKDVKVTAKVVAHTLDDKKVAFKFRCRKGVAKKHGHRQQLTALNISKIDASK